MKWNWGTKIALLYSSFVFFILYLVYLSFKQDFDLVTEDYYAEEIKYQETIDSKARADALETNLQAIIESKKLVVLFPQSDAKVNGNIKCFRPSDKTKDFEVEVKVDDGKFSIPIEKFISGKYLLKVDWSSRNENYYKELTVIIP